MKLSIIIPYYNTWEYTEPLLKSIQYQIRRLSNIEIIIIDDGCNETRLDQFAFAKIIHLDKNYGASHAWNVGLSQATGEYIGFIDSDDMIVPNYFDVLLYAMEKENTDEIIFGFWSTKNDFTILKPICRAIWKAIYKRWLVPQFDETLQYNTDAPFFKHMCNTTHTKSYIGIPLYTYRENREGSITWKKRHGLFDKEE